MYYLAAAVACLLPIGAIAVLTTAETTREKLLYILGFTLLFVLDLVILADSKITRINILVASVS